MQNAGATYDRLLLGLDTIEKRWVGQLELVFFSWVQLVVGLRLWHSLDESLEVTAVPLDLETVQVKNVSDGSVQEARVVRDDD